VNEPQPTWADFVAGWDLGIYRDPVLCAGFVGLVLGALGVFVVLRRAVFVTAVVTQSAGLGVATAFFLEIHAGLALPPSAGALCFAIAAMAVLVASARVRLPRESVLGFAYVVTSAAALLVGDRITQEAHDITSILFGTAVMVRPEDVRWVFAVGSVVLAGLAVSYRGLVFVGFDPQAAQVQGLPVKGLELMFWLLVALEVSVAARALGSLPVFAFAVLPAMAALAVTNGLGPALLLAAVLGALSGVGGYLAAYFFGFPVGASQAALAATWLVCAFPASYGKARLGRAHAS